MRPTVALAVPSLFLLTQLACSGGGGVGRTVDTGGDNCPTGSVAVDTSMTVTQLAVNNVVFANVVHVPGKSYDDYGSAGCYDETTGAVTWVMESGDEAIGTLEMYIENPSEGNLNLQSYTDYFQFRFSGPDGVAQFNNFDFITGTWVVNTSSPLEVSILGQANKGGGFMDVNLAAEVKLP